VKAKNNRGILINNEICIPGTSIMRVEWITGFHALFLLPESQPLSRPQFPLRVPLRWSTLPLSVCAPHGRCLARSLSYNRL
jgi:hypothetical protein